MRSAFCVARNRVARVRPTVCCLPMAVLFALLASPASAAPAVAPSYSSLTLTVNPVGDADWQVSVTFSEENYKQIKSEEDRDALRRRYLMPFLPNWARMTKVQEIQFNDQLHSLSATWTTPGLAVPQADGTWTFPLHTIGKPTFTIYKPDDIVTWPWISLTSSGRQRGNQDYVEDPFDVGTFGARLPRSLHRAMIPSSTEQNWSNASMIVNLPQGSTKLQVSLAPLSVTFQPPPYVSAKAPWLLYDPTANQSGSLEPDHAFDLQTQTYVVPALAKVYGNRRFRDAALARSLFTNHSNQVLHNYRVRFRMGRYTDPIWSPWQQTAEVRPGQSIVRFYYPLLDVARLARRTNPGPVDVEAEYKYQLPDGKIITERSARRTTLLGFNEVVFSRKQGSRAQTFQREFELAPALLAAYVTPNDPPIRTLSAWANRRAGGLESSADDVQAMKFLKSWYELLADNGFRYEDIPIVLGNDHRLSQRIKYPREVLADKGGNCIEAALLFASGCEAQGLHPIVCLVRGHCFPAVRLPSGQILGVEATEIGTSTFEQAVAFGTREYYAWKGTGNLLPWQTINKQKSWIQIGLFVPADVDVLRNAGFYSMDLPMDREGTTSLREWNWRNFPAAKVNPLDLSKPAFYKADVWTPNEVSTANVYKLFNNFTNVHYNCLQVNARAVQFGARMIQLCPDGKKDRACLSHQTTDGKVTKSMGGFQFDAQTSELMVKLDDGQPEKGTFHGTLIALENGGFRWIGEHVWLDGFPRSEHFMLTFHLDKPIAAAR